MCVWDRKNAKWRFLIYGITLIFAGILWYWLR